MAPDSELPTFDPNFFSISQHLMGVIRADFSVVQANPALLKILGVNGLADLNFSHFVHPGDFAEVQAGFKRLGTERGEAALIFRLKRFDGKFIWTNWALTFDTVTHFVFACAFPITSQIYDHVSEKNVGPAFGVGGWQLSKKTRQLKWSPECFKIHQFDRSAFDPHFDHYLEKIRQDFRPQFSKAMDQLIEKGEGFNLKVPITSGAGEVIWIRMTGQVFSEQDDDFSVGGVVQDITEDVLRGHQLESLLTSLNDLLAEINIDGKILNIWTKNDELLFLPRAQIVGASVSDILLPEDSQKALVLIRHTIADKVKTEMEFCLPLNDQLWFNARFCYLHDSPSSDTRALAVITDISQRRAAERELRRSQALLFSIIDNVPAFIYAKNLNGQYIFVNREFSESMKIPRPIQEGTVPADIFGPEASSLINQHHRRIIETKLPVTTEEYVFVSADKTQWLSTRFPIFDERGNVVALAGISTNITQQKLQAAKLTQASKMASLGEMSGGVAHEISNPLTIMMGKASILREKIERGCTSPKEMLADLDRIEAMGERISKIIRGLRLFSRDGHGDQFQISSLRSVVDETLEFCRSRFQAAGIIIDVDLIPDELEIEMRSVEISQVLLNLLNNAYDAIKGDTRSREDANIPDSYPLKVKELRAIGQGRVAIEFQDLITEVLIAITDSGPGVPSHLRDQIMIPFFTTKEVGKGIGLGLSLSKGIAERHRGSLLLDTESPETRFVLRLPKRQRSN